MHRRELSEYQNIYIKKRLKIDLKFCLNFNIKSAIWQSLHGTKNRRKWQNLVGYDVLTLKKHLQKTMPKGYTWNDYLAGNLHIDHKIPISVFNFIKPEHIDFKRCWALKNLQLLPAKDNLKKSNKLTRSFQPSLAL